MADEVGMRRVFLVERYVPKLQEDRLSELAARLTDATRELCRQGEAAVWIGSIAVVPEETVFCVFSARSADIVRVLNDLADLPYERIVAALQLRERPN